MMIPAGSGCTEEGHIDYYYKSSVVRNWSAGRDSTTNHHPALPALSASLLSAAGDREAIQSWIGARKGSEFTATSYRRDARRLLLWLHYECLGKSQSQMNVDDCGNFMAFLQNIPIKWISRVHVKPGAPEWAPFRGPLSRNSQAQAVVILASLFTWLQAERYLEANP